MDHDAALAEVQRLQTQLDSLREEMVWSNRLTTLGTLSAVLAHEYNNLLTPIASYAQLALKQPGDSALTEKALRSAVEGVQQAARLAEATLGFARPEHRPSQHEETTLAETIDAALACLGRPLAQDGIALRVNTPDDPLAIEPLALQQVLVNLLTNARKAMLSSPKPRRLSIDARREGEGVLIEVADSGPGIPADLLDRVFDPFVSTPGPTPTDHPAPAQPEGTGLGLSICRDLVDAVGGWITAENSGDGAVIRLWLPLA